MKSKVDRNVPDVILRDGRPADVILDIEVLMELEEMRKKPLKFRKLEDFLKEHNPSVCEETRG